MKLLIVTQTVHRDDTVLGFFHGWISEFAKHFENLTVVCLYEGEHSLPSNVKVLSLGKEKGVSKVKYLRRFYKYIWSERKNYDGVFVHMNEEYVLLGGLLWNMLGKKIGMWRNHHAGNFLTEIAMAMCDKVFCTSKYSYTAKNRKTKFMPIGIDTDLFKKDESVERAPGSILSLGRISPSKRLSLLIDVLNKLKTGGIQFGATVIGDPLPKDVSYANELVKKSNDFGLNVRFEKGIPNRSAPKAYSAHEIFVNLSSSGMYDKTIFEAMSCECTVLASNENLRDIISDQFIFGDQDGAELEEKLKILLNMPEGARKSVGQEFRQIVIEKHSLKRLAENLETEYSMHHESH